MFVENGQKSQTGNRDARNSARETATAVVTEKLRGDSKKKVWGNCVSTIVLKFVILFSFFYFVNLPLLF
jgi:hypothetical protein